MIDKLEQALEKYSRAAEEFNNAALLASSDCTAKLKLYDSRKLREKALDAQILGARAEARIMSIPIVG